MSNRHFVQWVAYLQAVASFLHSDSINIYLACFYSELIKWLFFLSQHCGHRWWTRGSRCSWTRCRLPPARSRSTPRRAAGALCTRAACPGPTRTRVCCSRQAIRTANCPSPSWSSSAFWPDRAVLRPSTKRRHWASKLFTTLLLHWLTLLCEPLQI